MKLSVYSQAGDVVGEVELADAVFATDVRVPLMHQMVVGHLANGRVGTASTKTRAEVRGTTKKVYKQKGTGRARHGSRKVNLWTGGGVAHGPHPRSYDQHLPKKMRRAAIRSALTAKARDGQIILVDKLTFERPRTQDMVAFLGKLPVKGSMLLTLDSGDQNALLSARNIPRLATLPALSLNTYDILKMDYLIATVPAIRSVEQWLGDGSSEESATTETPAAAPRARRASATASAPAKSPAAPARARRSAAAIEAPAASADSASAESDAAGEEAPKRRSRARKTEADE